MRCVQNIPPHLKLILTKASVNPFLAYLLIRLNVVVEETVTSWAEIFFGFLTELSMKQQ